MISFLDATNNTQFDSFKHENNTTIDLVPNIRNTTVDPVPNKTNTKLGPLPIITSHNRHSTKSASYGKIAMSLMGGVGILSMLCAMTFISGIMCSKCFPLTRSLNSNNLNPIFREGGIEFELKEMKGIFLHKKNSQHLINFFNCSFFFKKYFFTAFN